MEYVRVRFVAGGIAIVALLAALALPASALAATFANEYPTGSLNAPPPVLSLTAFSAVAFDTRYIQLKIDGVAYKTLMQAGSAAGYWLATEVWSPTSKAWTVKWSWVPTTADPNKLTLYAYPAFTPALTDGIHTVTATVKDKAGVTSTDSWTFSYGTAPVLGTPAPIDGSTVDTTTPIIELPVADNSPGIITAAATVNGVAAPAAVLNGAVRVTSPTLTNDATTTVTVTVTDAAGYSSSKTWTFWVEIYPEMSSSGATCLDCHVGYDTDNDMGPDCMLCHSGVAPRPHQGTPSAYHTKADVTECAPCHVSDLSVEHARYALTCATCHSSATPAVSTAIAAGQTSCTSCHQGAGHSAAHTQTLPAFCAKAGCHVETNLLDEHTNAPINPPSDVSCATCHSSSAPAVVSAIANHDKSCVTCHGQMLSGHDAMHESVMEPECLHCHEGSVSAEHIVLHNTGGARTCSSCHESTEPRIVTAIANQDRTCAGCHADAGHNTGHASDFDGQDCADCHDANVQVEHHRLTASSASARCANCHLTPSSVVVDALGGAVWDKRCAQTGCHVAGSTTEAHGAMGAAHATGDPAPSCLADGCHVGTDLSVIHASASTNTPEGPRTGCLVCHSAQALPASNQCADCHPDRLVSHGYDPAKHVGTDAAVRVASLSDGGDERGCSDTLPDQRGCHDISSLGELHRDAPDGCDTCHGVGKTPSTECLTCHPTSGSGGGTPPETLATVSYYHHNNVKYLISSLDATPNPYYNADGNPDSGWYDSAYYNDCSDLCHHSYVEPGTFDARTGQRMWFSAPGGGGWYGPQMRTLTSTTTVLPAGAYLDFSTYYLLQHSWGNGVGYVEASTDGGNSWVALIGTVNGATVSSITGSSSAWVTARYDLSAYVGQQAQVRFRFDDQAGWCDGWALDDIVIGGTDGVISSEGAESSLSEWTSSYWIRSMSAYPAF